MSDFKFYTERDGHPVTLLIEITNSAPIEWRQVGTSIPLTASERSCIDEEAETVIWEKTALLKPMFGDPIADLNRIVEETFPK